MLVAIYGNLVKVPFFFSLVPFSKRTLELQECFNGLSEDTVDTGDKVPTDVFNLGL